MGKNTNCRKELKIDFMIEVGKFIFTLMNKCDTLFWNNIHLTHSLVFYFRTLDRTTQL